LIGHSFATQYLTISRLPCPAATQIVSSSHLHFFSSHAHLSNSSLFVWATPQQKYGSYHQLDGDNGFFHANSKVDIDDISLTLYFFFNSLLRDDLFTNALVSPFTPYKNLRSVPFNLGKIWVKQISSHFTITSHKEDGEEQLLSSSIALVYPPPQRGFLFSLFLRFVPFEWKVVKYKHTCRHAIREIFSPK